MSAAWLVMGCAGRAGQPPPQPPMNETVSEPESQGLEENDTGSGETTGRELRAETFDRLAAAFLDAIQSLDVDGYIALHPPPGPVGVTRADIGQILVQLRFRMGSTVSCERGESDDRTAIYRIVGEQGRWRLIITIDASAKLERMLLRTEP